MVEIKICNISKDARDVTHAEWVEEVKKCPCDSVPVNEQDNFWTVGETGYWIPKKTGDLSKDMKAVIKRKRSELYRDKKQGLGTEHLQKLIDELTEFRRLLG